MENTPKAIRFLMDDHKRLKGLFRQFEGIDKRAHVMKAGVCREIFMEIEIHTQIEESFFYPTVQESTLDKSLATLVDDCESDHDRLKGNIEELKALDINHEFYRDGMDDLISEIELHITKEETELFPKIQLDFNATQAIEQIVNNMADERSRMLALPEYRDALPEVVQDPTGGEQKRTKRVA